MRDVGFIYIINHGIENELVDQMFEISREYLNILIITLT